MLPEQELEELCWYRDDERHVFLPEVMRRLILEKIMVHGGERGGGERHALAMCKTGHEWKDLLVDNIERWARKNEKGQPHGEEGAMLDQLSCLMVGATATGSGWLSLLLQRALDKALHPRTVREFLLALVQHRPDSLNHGHILLEAVQHWLTHKDAKERLAGEHVDVLEVECGLTLGKDEDVGGARAKGGELQQRVLMVTAVQPALAGEDASQDPELPPQWLVV